MDACFDGGGSCHGHRDPIELRPPRANGQRAAGHGTLVVRIILAGERGAPFAHTFRAQTQIAGATRSGSRALLRSGASRPSWTGRMDVPCIGPRSEPAVRAFS